MPRLGRAWVVVAYYLQASVLRIECYSEV